MIPNVKETGVSIGSVKNRIPKLSPSFCYKIIIKEIKKNKKKTVSKFPYLNLFDPTKSSSR